MGKSKEQLCQTADQQFTNSFTNSSLQDSTSHVLFLHPITPYFLSIPRSQAQVAKNDSYTGKKLMRWVEREQCTKVFLLRQKNINTFQDSNCLFGIASMERLRGGDRGEKYTKVKEGGGPFYSPQSCSLPF